MGKKRPKNKPAKTSESSHKNRPLSLAPLDFEQAVEGLLAVKPARHADKANKKKADKKS